MPITHKLQRAPVQHETIVHTSPTSLDQEVHNLVVHLGHVLAIHPDEHVLLVPGDVAMSALTLVNSFNCRVTMLVEDGMTVEPTSEHLTVQQGSLSKLPFATGTFDVILFASTSTSGFWKTSEELARVLRRNGRLGMVALSPYAEQLGDEPAIRSLEAPLLARTRSAAAYRAILGEAGFTAFVTEDKRRQVRQSADAIYREHMLTANSQATTLELLARGGLTVTLITAEKAL
ncbi:MAG: hypothetical protein NVS4B8_21630 [Herpetosiphon sp.]